MLRLDNVEAKKAEALAIADRRHAADRLAAAFAEEEAVRVGGNEACGIEQARVPALLRRPIEGETEFVLRHPANNQRVHGFSPRFRTNYTSSRLVNAIAPA